MSPRAFIGFVPIGSTLNVTKLPKASDIAIFLILHLQRIGFLPLLLDLAEEKHSFDTMLLQREYLERPFSDHNTEQSRIKASLVYS
jgi:hypothetical protein